MPDVGDRSFFERTVLPHLDTAYNVARWILRNDADAQDVVQESFMRALRYQAGLRGQDALPWLLRIVRNTAYTWLDRRRRDDELEHLAEDTSIADESASDPATVMADKVDVEALRHAVDALPDEFREVLVMRELEGMSYKEIAAATGTSIGTVMSRLSRARKRLQVSLVPDAQKEIDHGM